MPKFKITVKSRKGKIPPSFETIIEAEDQKAAMNKYRAALVLSKVDIEPVEEKRSTLRIAV